MSRNLRILLTVVPVASVALLALSLRFWPVDFNGSFWGFSGQAETLAALSFWVVTTVVASGAPIQMPRGSLVSVGAAPIIAASVLGGPTAGAIVAVLGTVEVRELKGRVPWYGVLYNHSFPVLAAVSSGMVFILFSGSAGI
ncbi:MAG: hypothetical protein AB1Z63_00090, partial [Candidatus Limnocylindrales bacterium]